MEESVGGGGGNGGGGGGGGDGQRGASGSTDIFVGSAVFGLR